MPGWADDGGARVDISQRGGVKGPSKHPEVPPPPGLQRAFSITVLIVCRLPQGACLPSTLPAGPSAQTSASNLSRNLRQGSTWHTNPALGWSQVVTLLSLSTAAMPGSLLTHGRSSVNRDGESDSVLAAPTWCAPQLSRDKPIPSKPREGPQRTVSHLFVLLTRSLWWLRPLTLF